MSSLCTILIAANLSASGQAAPNDWHLWLYASSGWGGMPAIYVDSKGRNVAYGDSQGRNLAVDLRRGVPSSYCEESPLTAEQVRDIESQLARIPSNVLANGGLEIMGNCFDEPRNAAVLTMRGLSYQFSYSLENGCNGGQRVPEWLTTLVRGLWKRHEAIKECKAVPQDETSHQ